MRSRVTEVLDAEERDRNLRVPLEERLILILELGEQQLQQFMTANGLERDEAMRRIEHSRQRGRRRSSCMEEVIDASRPDGS